MKVCIGGSEGGRKERAGKRSGGRDPQKKEEREAVREGGRWAFCTGR